MRMLQLTLAINRIASVAPLLAEQVMVAFGLLTPSKRSVRRNVCVATLLAEQGMVMEPSPPAQCKDQRTKEIAGKRVCTIACVLSSAMKQCGDRIRLLRPILVL